jgi:hypothetical protein
MFIICGSGRWSLDYLIFKNKYSFKVFSAEL